MRMKIGVETETAQIYWCIVCQMGKTLEQGDTCGHCTGKMATAVLTIITPTVESEGDKED